MGEPIQPFKVGVTVSVAVCVVVTLAVVKFRLLVPDAGSPIAMFEFVQLYVALGVLEKGTTKTVPPQAVLSVMPFIIGVGFTVTLKFCAAPAQPSNVGVTVMVPVCWLATFAAVKAILPEPEVPKPMAVFEFDQAKLAPSGVLTKFTFSTAPPQTV